MYRISRRERDTAPFHEIEALRAAIGPPPLDRIERVLEEVERQVAVEDLVILLIETTQATMKAFFDVLGEIQAPSSWSAARGDDQGDRT